MTNNLLRQGCRKLTGAEEFDINPKLSLNIKFRQPFFMAPLCYRFFRVTVFPNNLASYITFQPVTRTGLP